MNTLRFMDDFSTEEACKNHFRIQREQEGINCKKICDTYHYCLKSAGEWQCRNCDFRTTLKIGHVGQRRMNVSVMAESTPLEDIETGKKSSQCRYFKMKVLYDHKSETINDTLEENIQEKSIVFSDKSTSYVDISDYVEIHMTEKSDKKTTKTTLKWVHIAISNAKRSLLGVFHKIKGKYLQLYLNEFCYKLNRRYFGSKVFDRLTLAVAKSYW